LAGNRWFLLAVIGGFSAIGLAFVIGGDASQRAVGIFCVLSFGVAGGAAVVGEFISAPPPPLMRGLAALPDGTTQPALVLEYRRYPLVLRAVAALGLLASGAVFALAPDSGRLVATVRDRVLVGFGAAVGFAWFAVGLRRGAAVNGIFLTPIGVLVGASWANRCVPWASVRSVERRDRRGLQMLDLVLASPDAVVRTGSAMRFFAIVETLFYGRNRMPVSLRGLAMPPDDVVALVKQFRSEAISARRESADEIDLDVPLWFEKVASGTGLSAATSS
jgi:hypothetical protein